MMRFHLLAACLAVVTTSLHAQPADVAAAVAAASDRSEDNVKLDAGRKPAEVLAFMGLQKGDQVLDLFGGNRYWAEITSKAVGANGFVTVWNPTQFLNDKAKAKFAEFAAGRGNVLLLASPFERPQFGTDRYDVALMNLDYHDVYWESEKYKITRMEPSAWVAALYAALKPGGSIVVIDHVGPAGDTRAIVEKLHRIDPAVVKADFERGGFVLEGTSDMLANSADDHSLNVFDPAIRGKTDRFVMKFRKPR